MIAGLLLDSQISGMQCFSAYLRKEVAHRRQGEVTELDVQNLQPGTLQVSPRRIDFGNFRGRQLTGLEAKHRVASQGAHVPPQP